MKDKKRVLLVSCGGLGNGGVQAILMGIVRSLSSKFVFDVLVFTSEVRHYDKEFLSYGGEIIRIPHYEGNNKYIRFLDFNTRDLFIYKKVRDILRNRNPYVAVHCNKEYESAPILKAAFDCGIPIRICHNHIINQKSGFLCNTLNKIRLYYIKKYSTLNIGCSKESCYSLYGNENYSVMNNFYDDKRFSSSLYYKTKKKSVLSLVQVGALNTNKNQIFSINILSEIKKCGIESDLTIVGFELENGYRKKVIDEINRLGLSAYVRLLPGDSNIPMVLSQSSVFLMPSVKEGFGIVLIEAQAMGLRCFASSVVPHSTNCGGVEYLDLSRGAHYWATTIIDVLKKNDCQGCSFDTERFKLSNISKQYEKLYEK